MCVGGACRFLLRRFLKYSQLVNLRLVMFSAGGQSRLIVNSMYRWSENECSIWLSRGSDIRVMSSTSLLFLVMNVGSLPLLQMNRFD